MDNCKEVCHLCEQPDDTVFDGMCETCEPIWYKHIGNVSKQLDENTRLANFFEQAAMATKEQIKKSDVANSLLKSKK